MRLKYEFFNQIKQLPLMPQLLDVSHISKRGVSLRSSDVFLATDMQDEEV